MRKWINLCELSMSDFSGDGDGEHRQTIIVHDIDWDTDGEDVDLPKEVTMEISGEDDDDIEDQIADHLSDKYGWTVNSFERRFI